MGHYIPVNSLEREQMLAALGRKDAMELFKDIPDEMIFGPRCLKVAQGQKRNGGQRLYAGPG